MLSRSTEISVGKRTQYSLNSEVFLNGWRWGLLADSSGFRMLRCISQGWLGCTTNSDELEYMNETWGRFWEVSRVYYLDAMNLVSTNLESISVC